MPTKDIRADELREMIKNNRDNLEIIDVREQDEYDAVHIKGSKLIPLGEIQDRVGEIDWSKEVVFLCRSGSRSKIATHLVGSGHEMKNLQYGIYECLRNGKGENLEVDEDMIGRYF